MTVICWLITTGKVSTEILANLKADQDLRKIEEIKEENG